MDAPPGTPRTAPAVSASMVVASVALAGLVGLSALAGPVPTALAVAFAALVMVWGWALLTDAPSQRAATVVVGLGALSICATAVLTRTEPYLVWVPAALAVSVIAAMLHQVLRRGARPRLTDGLAAATTALALTASGAALIPLPHDLRGSRWVAVAMAAVIVAAVLMLIVHRPGAGAWVLVATIVLGAGAAVLAALIVTGIPLLGAAVLGVLVGAVAHSLLRVLAGVPAARVAQAAVAAGASAVLVVGVLVFLVARVYATQL